MVLLQVKNIFEHLNIDLNIYLYQNSEIMLRNNFHVYFHFKLFS